MGATSARVWVAMDPPRKISDESNAGRMAQWAAYQGFRKLRQSYPLYEHNICKSCPSGEDDLSVLRGLAQSFDKYTAVRIPLKDTRIGTHPNAIDLTSQLMENLRAHTEEVDILNWNDWIVPIPRPSRYVRAKLRHVGRGKPIPAEDPWA